MESNETKADVSPVLSTDGLAGAVEAETGMNAIEQAKQDALEADFLSLTLEKYKELRMEIEFLRHGQANYRRLAIEFKSELDDAERSIDDLKDVIGRILAAKAADEEAERLRADQDDRAEDAVLMRKYDQCPMCEGKGNDEGGMCWHCYGTGIVNKDMTANTNVTGLAPGKDEQK